MRLTQYEGIKTVGDLANYTNDELDLVADCNSYHTPKYAHVQMDLASTATLKAITHWDIMKICEGVNCDLHELMQSKMIVELRDGKKDFDSMLNYPDPCTSNNYKDWIK